MKKQLFFLFLLLASCASPWDIDFDGRQYKGIIGQTSTDRDFYNIGFNPEEPFVNSENVTKQVDYFRRLADSEMQRTCMGKNKKAVRWTKPIISSREKVTYNGSEEVDNSMNPMEPDSFMKDKIWFYYKCQ